MPDAQASPASSPTVPPPPLNRQQDHHPLDARDAMHDPTAGGHAAVAVVHMHGPTGDAERDARGHAKTRSGASALAASACMVAPE